MIQRHILLLLTLSLAILTTVPSSLHAAETIDPLDSTPSVIRFNVATGGYPPYTIIDDDGQVSGIMWDVMSALASALDLELEVRQIPTKRVETFMLAGQLDVSMRAREWSKQPEKFLFTDSVLKVQDVIFTRAESPLQAKVIEDLKGKTLLAQLGYRYPSLEACFEAGAITRLNVSNQQSMFQRLHGAERFDGLISDLRNGRWMIQTHGWDGQFIAEPLVVDETEYRFMFAPHWAEYLSDFNRTLQSMRDSGELDTILARY